MAAANSTHSAGEVVEHQLYHQQLEQQRADGGGGWSPLLQLHDAAVGSAFGIGLQQLQGETDEVGTI